MSDFLSGFSKKQRVEDQIKNNDERAIATDLAYVEEKSEDETLLVKDPGYHRTKRKKKIVKISLVLMIAALIVYSYIRFNYTELPDFKNASINEAVDFARKEGINLDVDEQYNFEVDASIIIKQNIASGTVVKKDDTLKLEVSKGPDPSEVIPLPDFSTMDYDEALDFRNTNKAYNLHIKKEWAPDVAGNQYIREVFRNEQIDRDSYTRNDTLEVFYAIVE